MMVQSSSMDLTVYKDRLNRNATSFLSNLDRNVEDRYRGNCACGPNARPASRPMGIVERLRCNYGQSPTIIHVSTLPLGWWKSCRLRQRSWRLEQGRDR